MSNWKIAARVESGKNKISGKQIREILLVNRGLETPSDIKNFLSPSDPVRLKPEDVKIKTAPLKKTLNRLKKAIEEKESIVVYADYDADGITAGAVMWESLYLLGARVMPYIPHRVEEGYGLSEKGIDAVIEMHHPSLIITVDHGITAGEKVKYANGKGVEVIVTDHHTIPDDPPGCITVHTTSLSGAGISWFVAKELIRMMGKSVPEELLALCAIGTIADMVPLVGANRSIASFGLSVLNRTERIGLLELISDAGLETGKLDTYSVSHVLAPRLNAMGRLVHAMDALRLICTTNRMKARELARTLGLTNRERQQMTIDSTLSAKNHLHGKDIRKLIFVSDAEYNQGVIGLVAGRLTEEYYRPSIVVSVGDDISKASARSVAGFNIVEAIRSFSSFLVDVGGHPMAAGFTITTANLVKFREAIVGYADENITDEMLVKTLSVDAEIPFTAIDDKLWEILSAFKPFGFGNPEPVFVSRDVRIVDSRAVGTDGRHLKLRVSQKDGKETPVIFDGIAFGKGGDIATLRPGTGVDLAYTIDMNHWNGRSSLQLKVRDIHVTP